MKSFGRSGVAFTNLSIRSWNPFLDFSSIAAPTDHITENKEISPNISFIFFGILIAF